jgi:murein DD-endopeptidase MepM/ murein hydrolase activator NlpD
VRAHGRVQALILSQRLQLGVVGATAFAGLWLIAITAGFVGQTDRLMTQETVYERTLDSLEARQAERIRELKDKHFEIESGLRAELANARESERELLADLDLYHQKFTHVTGALDQSRDQMKALIDQNRGLQDNLASLKSRLELTGAERANIAHMRDLMTEELDDLDEKLQDMVDRNGDLRADVTDLRTALNQVSSERIAVVEEREMLVARVRELETTVLETKRAQRDVLLRLAETTSDNIGAVERTIELTGLDPEMLLARAEEVSGGQGGPFVAFDAVFASLKPLDENAALLDRKITRLERLQEMVRVLPLNAPMDDYRLTSGFGKRKDPVNGRLAMHSGIDFVGERRAVVLAPSGGTVDFVGWKGGFGKVVEIDHGYGIKTRFAHLGKIFVKRGQEVKYRDKLGQVGSTGRTTGPHLHYEVLIDDEPTDPMPFLRAGRHVFKG